jgi:hypothetical protein
MIVSPLLRGMMGLSVDALNSTVRFAPHVPADWNDFSIGNLAVGSASLSLTYHRSSDEITLQIQRKGSGKAKLVFQPAFSLRAQVVEAQINGRRAEVRAVESNTVDQHVSIELPISTDSTTVRLLYRHDFGIAYPYVAPQIGAVSSDIKFVSQQWNASHDRLELRVAGVSGRRYEVPVYGDLSGMTASGAEVKTGSKQPMLEIDFPSGPAGSYSERQVVLQFPKL